MVRTRLNIGCRYSTPVLERPLHPTRSQFKPQPSQTQAPVTPATEPERRAGGGLTTVYKGFPPSALRPTAGFRLNCAAAGLASLRCHILQSADLLRDEEMTEVGVANMQTNWLTIPLPDDLLAEQKGRSQAVCKEGLQFADKSCKSSVVEKVSCMSHRES